jgi:hypothetical protein
MMSQTTLTVLMHVAVVGMLLPCFKVDLVISVTLFTQELNYIICADFLVGERSFVLGWQKTLIVSAFGSVMNKVV